MQNKEYRRQLFAPDQSVDALYIEPAPCLRGQLQLLRPLATLAFLVDQCRGPLYSLRFLHVLRAIVDAEETLSQRQSKALKLYVNVTIIKSW